jgi:hypothetical protein
LIARLKEGLVTLSQHNKCANRPVALKNYTK